MHKSPIRCLTIMVTNQCPLQCAHCGPESGPGEREHLDLETVIAALDEAKERACLLVAFSGGEPFIIGDGLTDMAREAAERELTTRVITSAYWGRTADAAHKRLEPLVRVGLNQLCISCGEAHQAAVPLQHVIHATRAARSFGLKVFLNVGLRASSRCTMRTVRNAFDEAGVSIPLMSEGPYIPFGRGQGYRDEDLILQPIDKIAGPCPSITQHPTIHSTGQVTGCAVVFGRTCAPLSFGSLQAGTLGGILDKMNEDPVALWIHRFGVVELKNLIESNSSIRFRDRYVNICHLCGDILHNPEALEVLKDLGFIPKHDSTERAPDLCFSEDAC